MFRRPKATPEYTTVITETPLPTRSSTDSSSGVIISKQWGVHWITPFRMVTAFLTGLLCAVGHHIFYKSLVDQDAVNQQVNVRAGTALAFLSRAWFAAAVGMAHRQRIWFTLRRKYITIEGIDALFSATADPAALLIPDMLLNAKVSTLMACICWLLPLSAIIVPATLSVHYKHFGPYTLPDTQVPFLNTTTLTYNYTPAAKERWSLGSMVNIGYDSNYLFMGPSASVTTLTLGTVLSQQIPNIESPCGTNCSYDMEFYGPSLKCELGLSPSMNYTNDSLPWNGWIDGNLGTVVYYAAKVPVVENSTDWKNGLTERLQVLSRWGNKDKQYILDHRQATLCSPYNSSYDVELRFTNGLPTYDVRSVTPVQALNYSSIPRGAYDDITSWPSLAVTESLYDVLLGYVSYTNMENVIDNQYILGSKLIVSYNMTGRINVTYTSDIISVLEEMSWNATLALLSITPDRTGMVAQSTKLRLVYAYSEWVLLTTYAIAAVMALSCLVVGLVALNRNGIASDVSFSRVLVTTRSPEIDELARGACLGGDPFPRDVRKVRMKFGEIGGAKNGVGHAGFGTGGVRELRVGEKYE